MRDDAFNDLGYVPFNFGDELKKERWELEGRIRPVLREEPEQGLPGDRKGVWHLSWHPERLSEGTRPRLCPEQARSSQGSALI